MILKAGDIKREGRGQSEKHEGGVECDVFVCVRGTTQKWTVLNIATIVERLYGNLAKKPVLSKERWCS